MKLSKIFCLVLCAVLVFSAGISVSAQEETPSLYGSCIGEDATVALGGSEKMLETSTAVLVYERKSGTLIYGYNIDTVIYPASMVKMMTALVAIEQGNLSDVVTVSASALNSVAIGSVSAGLVRDEQLTLEDLLYCMMVASANDASAVIAEHIAGNQEAFLVLMNEKASEIGCTQTHFSNVHGLHDADTYTTARDICRLINAGLDNPVFRAMFETESYTVSATNKSEERVIYTTNNMMTKHTNDKYFDSRVTGGKTGATNQAGRCLAVSADIGNMEIVALVMGAKATYEIEGIALSRYGSFEEMAELLDYVEAGFSYGQIFYEGQVLSQYPVSGGSSNVAVAPTTTVYCVLPMDAQADMLTWTYGEGLHSLQAPVAKGTVLADLQVWYGSVCVGVTDLVATADVDVYVPYTEPVEDVAVENEEKHGKVIAAVIGAVLAVIVLVFLILLAVRVTGRMLYRAKVRRRRRNRRRNRNV